MGAGSVGNPLLLERDAELELLNDTLAKATSGEGGILLFEGSAGVGKTRLLEEGAIAAGSMGMLVRTARGAEATSATPFRTIIDLFARDVKASLDGDGELVSGSAALALSLFVTDASVSGPQSHDSLLEGLFRLTANLGETKPTALIVDEANWLDDRSLAFFHYLSARLPELPLAVLLAARRPRTSFPQTLRELSADPGSTTALVTELSAAATSNLVRQVAFPDADDAFCAACYEVTRGNPFFLSRLLSELEQEAVPPTKESVARIQRLGPTGIAASVNSRLEALGPEAGEVARAAAILQEDASLQHVCRLADISTDRVTTEASRLVATGILAPSEPLVFVHPIVRSSIVNTFSKDDLSRLHARAAAALSKGGASVDRVAPHVMASEPGTHPNAVPVLSEAAEIAAERGAIATEVSLLRRLLGEGLTTAEEARVLARLGEGEALIGDALALDRFRSALELLDDATDRASVLLRMGHTLVRSDRKAEAADAFRNGSAELEPGASTLRGDLEIGFVLAGFLVPHLQLEATQRAAGLMAEIGADPTPAERSLLATVSLARLADLDAREEAVALAELAVGDGELLEHETSDGPTFSFLTGVFSGADRFDLTIRLATMGLDDARRRGSVMGFATASYCRCAPLMFVGRIAEAIADGEQVLAAGRYGWRLYWMAAVSRLAIAQMERGDLEDAERTLAVVDEDEGRESLEFGMHLEARGRLRLAQDRPEHALTDLLESNRILSSNPFIGNPGFPNGKAATAEALVKLGRPEEAVASLDPELERARRWGAPRPIGALLRARGMAVGGESGIEHLRESVNVLERSPSRLELVRAQVTLGGALADAGDDTQARSILSAALEAAQQMQARLIAEEALAKLVKAGGRPRRLRTTGVSSLTPAELRVARMAAEGLTNREMAEQLFVTVKAIERHVSSIYAKLEVTSRPDLITRFGDQLTADPM